MTSTGLRRGGNAHMSATYSANASSDRMDIDESMKASYAGYESEESDSSDEWPKPPKLPYDVSYVGKWAPPMRPRPEKKIWPTAERPITTRSELPPGWTDNEDDLFEDEIEEQIERCYERIAQNIYPDIFKRKLQSYQQQKEEKDLKMMQYPGLSWEAVKRIEQLKNIGRWLEKEGDRHTLIPIVIELIKQYKSKELDVHPGLVTYWSDGKRITEPRPYDRVECLELSREHNGHRAFWVEGSNNEPTRAAASRALCQTSENDDLHLYIAVRFPGEEAAVWNFRFRHDTGCDMMTMFEDDIDNLANDHMARYGVNPTRPPLLGVKGAFLADGTTAWTYCRLMQVTMLDDDDNRMEQVDPWDVIEVQFLPGNSAQPGRSRLDGPWLRHKFYTATSPKGTPNVYIFDKQTGFGRFVPKLAADKRVAPAWQGAYPAVALPPAPPKMAPGMKKVIPAFVIPGGSGVAAPKVMPGGRKVQAGPNNTAS